jgi:hypothetical protein
MFQTDGVVRHAVDEMERLYISPAHGSKLMEMQTETIYLAIS